MDTGTEPQFQRALDAVLKGRTSFVIAHRLSTIRNADQVLVLDQGRIVERGRHEELLEQKGFYYNLYMSQFRRQEGSPVAGGDGRSHMNLTESGGINTPAAGVRSVTLPGSSPIVRNFQGAVNAVLPTFVIPWTRQ